VCRLYDLVQAFCRLLKHRQGPLLEGWIADCQASAIPERSQFATGLLRERERVVAAVTHSASLGPTEGPTTKLKVMKRTTCTGALAFRTSRQRVPHALEPTAACETHAARFHTPRNFPWLRPSPAL
jgi:transposase